MARRPRMCPAIRSRPRRKLSKPRLYWPNRRSEHDPTVPKTAGRAGNGWQSGWQRLLGAASPPAPVPTHGLKPIAPLRNAPNARVQAVYTCQRAPRTALYDQLVIQRAFSSSTTHPRPDASPARPGRSPSVYNSHLAWIGLCDSPGSALRTAPGPPMLPDRMRASVLHDVSARCPEAASAAHGRFPQHQRVRNLARAHRRTRFSSTWPSGTSGPWTCC